MRRIALPLVALLSLSTMFVWVAQWDRAGGGSTSGPTLPSAPWPKAQPSVVFGPAAATTGGEFVVGVLVPTAPPRRLIDLVPRSTWDEFVAEEARRSADPALETSEDASIPSFGSLGVTSEQRAFAQARRSTFAAVAQAVQAATNVRLVVRHLRASECDGVALVLVDGGVEFEDDAARLRLALRVGSRILCAQPGKFPVGEVNSDAFPPGVERVAVLVDRCVNAIRTSALVRRLAGDPLDIVSAFREGDDVIVRLASAPSSASLRNLADAPIVPDGRVADGSVRLRCPDPVLDPRAHRLVATWSDGDVTLRRAWRVVDLVGTADRRVLAPSETEIGALYAPRVLFVNSKTGAPVVGRNERISLVQGARVLAEAVASSDAAGSLDRSLRVPDDAAVGSAALHVGDDVFAVEVRSGVRLSVVTDRSIYRATDEVFVRVMAHRAATGRPVAGAEIVLRSGSVEQRVTTSAHGIASARFDLVEASLGTTRVEAKALDSTGSASFVVRAFEAPTFQLDASPRTLSLRVGESAPVVVTARYIGGGPVVGAAISAWTDHESRCVPDGGYSDAAGSFAFVVRVPNDATSTTVRVECRDADGRQMTAAVPLVVEGERRIPRVDLTPLEEPVVGKPCRVEVRSSEPGNVALTFADGTMKYVEVDRSGVAELTLIPTDSVTKASIEVNGGQRIERDFHATALEAGRLIVFPKGRTFRVGETLEATVLGPDGPAMLDVARGRSTLLARSVLIVGGHAHVSLPLDADLAGELTLRVWRMDGDVPSGGATRVLVVRGRSLSVHAHATRDEWRPGEVAGVDVNVAGRDGRPVAGVLGYWGVDEAVLTIAPWHEGREEIFDVANSGVEGDIGLVAMKTERGEGVRFASAREALGAPAAFSDLREDLPIRHVSAPFREGVLAKAARERVTASIQALRAAVIAAFQHVPLDRVRTASSVQEVVAFVLAGGTLDAARLLDPWGTPIAFGPQTLDEIDRPTDEPNSWWTVPGFRCTSAGPDLALGTSDDQIEAWEPISAYEVGGAFDRYFKFLARLGIAADASGLDAPFEGPANNGLIGLGGGAGGSFKGRGGRRNLRAGGGGRTAEVPIHVRRDFKPTLCFVPEAIVGSDGKAHLEIPLRDSITSWRLRLVASAADGATGTTETSIRVTQPLHAEPWIAPHLTIGDELDLPVAVHNETSEATDVALALSASSGISVLGDAGARVTVGPQGTGANTFRIRAVAPGSMTVRIDAKSAAAADVIERVIDVRPLARAVVETMNRTISADAPWSAAILASTAERPTEHRVSFFPSPLADVVGGFEGLIACPHG